MPFSDVLSTCRQRKTWMPLPKPQVGEASGTERWFETDLSTRAALGTPWTLAHQAPLSMGRILEWPENSLLQGLLPDPGMELGSLALQADSLPFQPPGKLRSAEWSSALCPQWTGREANICQMVTWTLTLGLGGRGLCRPETWVRVLPLPSWGTWVG